MIAIASTGGSGRTARWTLTGDGGSDLIAGGPGSDTIDGGSGTDGIYAAGGGVDTITCGSGFDIVRADADDTVASDCEWRIIALPRRSRPRSARHCGWPRASRSAGPRGAPSHGRRAGRPSAG